jgi:hypothetical protein
MMLASEAKQNNELVAAMPKRAQPALAAANTWKRIAVKMALESGFLETGCVIPTTIQALVAATTATTGNRSELQLSVMRTMLEARGTRDAILRCVGRWGQTSSVDTLDVRQYKALRGVVAKWLLAGNDNVVFQIGLEITKCNRHIVALPPRRKNNAKGAFEAFLSELVSPEGHWNQPSEDQIQGLQVHMRLNRSSFNAKTQDWIDNLSNAADQTKYEMARRELGFFLTRKKLDSKKRKRKQDGKEAKLISSLAPFVKRACNQEARETARIENVRTGALCRLATAATSIQGSDKTNIGQLTMPTTAPTTLVTGSPSCLWRPSLTRTRTMSPQNTPSPRPPLSDTSTNVPRLQNCSRLCMPSGLMQKQQNDEKPRATQPKHAWAIPGGPVDPKDPWQAV